MDPPATVLDEGPPMIVVMHSEFYLAVDDFDMLDEVTDVLMEALMVTPGVIEPDVSLSLTENQVLIRLMIEASDPIDGVALGMQAIRNAWRQADQDDDFGDHRLHLDTPAHLVQQMSVSTSELAPA